jgi:hypothetical protein
MHQPDPCTTAPNPGLSRRCLLRAGALGALGLGAARGWTAAGAAPAAGRARSVILVWLWGGPSHLDTFDPKPGAPIEYRGPFAPIASKVPGVQLCELLPELSRIADKFALIRTMAHDSTDHDIAGTMGLIGSGTARDVPRSGLEAINAIRPSLGSIVGRLRPGRPGALPSYVVLGDHLVQGHKRITGEGGGMLGRAYDPFRLKYRPGTGLELPDVELPKGVAPGRVDARWDLRDRLDAGGDAPSSGPERQLERHYALARALIADPGSLAPLDLAREPARVHQRYGPHRFGQCCLIARRLVEAGLPFIRVNWSRAVEAVEDNGDGGWDMHDRYFAIMQDQHGWMLDTALAALIEDLDERGLLATTLVVAIGEFGRTPKINDKAGREHHSLCYSALVAGGGVAGSRVVGSSDKRGERPVDVAFTPADLGATILTRLGIGTAELTAINVNPVGDVIDELF